MKKNISFSGEKVCNGVEKLAKAVGSTMGPGGRTVIIERKYTGPLITKDGVTVARETDLVDPEENLGAKIIKQVSMRAAIDAGDGTTTATVLAHALFKSGLEAIKNGARPNEIKKGMIKAQEDLIEEIDKNKRKVETEQEILNVAMISSNADTELAGAIAYAYKTVGNKGIVLAEDDNTSLLEVNVTDGFAFDRGYATPYFSNKENLNCEFKDAYVFVSEDKLDNIYNISNILDTVAKEDSSLVIIADDVSEEAMSVLIMNRLKINLKVCFVRSPSFGKKRKDLLNDICVITGATLVSKEKGLPIPDANNIAYCGRIKSAVISGKQTILSGGAGDTESIRERVNSITKELEQEKDEDSKQFLRERLAKIDGGIAVIKIGGLTEAEAKERKDRLDDALAAVKSALEDGIVEGGGVALLLAGTKLTKDNSPGYNIVAEATTAPLKKIWNNAGFNAAETIKSLKNLYIEKGERFGYDLTEVTNEKATLINPFEKGIVDPTKVVKTALKAAISSASTLLTTGCVMTLAEEEKEESNGL